MHPHETLEPAPADTTEQEERTETWTYRDVGIVTAFALVAQVFVYMVGLLAMVMIQGAGQGRFPPIETLLRHAAFLLPLQLLWWLVVFWLVYRVVRARDRRPFREAIAWVRPAWPIGAYVAGGILLALSVAAFSALMPIPRQKMPMEKLLTDPSSAILLAAFGVLISPAVEEMLFRGFLYPVMARAHGAATAAGATAVLFALLHGPQYGWAWQNFLLLTYVGVVFGIARVVTGSIVPSTLMHAAYNLTLFAGLYVSTQHFQDL